MTGPEVFHILTREQGEPVATVEVETNLAGRVLSHIAPAPGQEAWEPVLRHLLDRAWDEGAADPAAPLASALRAIHRHLPALRCAEQSAPSLQDDVRDLLTREALSATLLESAEASEALGDRAVRRLLGVIGALDPSDVPRFVEDLCADLEEAPVLPPRVTQRWSAALVREAAPPARAELLAQVAGALASQLCARARTGAELERLLAADSWTGGAER